MGKRSILDTHNALNDHATQVQPAKANAGRHVVSAAVMHNSKPQKNKNMRLFTFYLMTQISFMLFVSCGNENSKTHPGIIQGEDGSILIPMNNIPIRSVNMTDDNGLKQGTWQEDDRKEGDAVYSITKEYNYKNDTLHGYYLEYKPKSDDTLIYGNYSHGKKQGEWRFWAKDKNEIEKIEIYEDGRIVR
jgi:hypothetical protein